MGRWRGLGIINDFVFAPSPPKGSRAPTCRGIPGFPLCLSTHDLVPTILLAWKTMLQRFAVLLVALVCGCATGSRTALDHYRWAPEYFELAFPSSGWRYVNSLTSNGEHHEFYERRLLFCSRHGEQVSTSSYLPTRVGTEPAGADEVFKNVTNFLSQSYCLSVVVVERADDAITWEWSGISRGKAASQSGVEKIVRGTRGLYRLTYSHNSASLSPKQKRTWIPVIRDAKLVRRTG